MEQEFVYVHWPCILRCSLRCLHNIFIEKEHTHIHQHTDKIAMFLTSSFANFRWAHNIILWGSFVGQLLLQPLSRQAVKMCHKTAF